MEKAWVQRTGLEAYPQLAERKRGALVSSRSNLFSEVVGNMMKGAPPPCCACLRERYGIKDQLTEPVVAARHGEQVWAFGQSRVKQK